MIGNRIVLSMVVLLMILTSSGCGSIQVGLETQETGIEGEPPVQVSPQATSEVEDPEPTQEATNSDAAGVIRQEFKELGLSMQVPAELYVVKNRDVNFEDTGRLNGYQFRIQNYGAPDGQSSGDFQMYGHFQFNLPTISWDEFAGNTLDSPIYAYANEIEINGLRGFDTQFSGVRNRYVYQFYLDGYILTIAVADPTPENKARADEIIATLQFDPEQFTHESHLTLVSDPAQLFQVLIPDDWEYNFQSTVGQQLSSLEASSPDSEVIIDYEVEGPHANIFYKQGIELHIQVIDDDSLQFNPGWPDQQEYGVYFNGIPGTVYVFQEPSTVEGEIRSVSVTHDGRTYLLRFGYAEDADMDTIDHIVSHFIISPEEFYPTS